LVAKIICVGDELLSGNTLNTNAQFLSKRLLNLGVDVFSQAVVGDDKAAIREALNSALKQNDLVILTGGLGPTEDDLTKETVAEVLNKKLVLHKESLEKIEEYFFKTGRIMPECNKKQAMLPVGSIVMPNPNGTAPGCIIEEGKKVIILLPGPPKELEGMFNNSAAPYLKTLNLGYIKSTAINVFGVGESLIAEKLGKILSSKNPTCATYAKNGEVEIRITAKDASYAEAERLNDLLEKHNKSQDVLIRVNPGVEAHTHHFIQTATEDSKFGFSISNGDAKSFIDHVRSLKNLSLDIDKLEIPNVSMSYLSMGMSNDYKIAIEEGSTIVRIGTSIFGQRNL